MRPADNLRVTPTHILSAVSQLPTGARIARRDAVSRLRSPKTTVYPSTTGATPKCLLFDRVARAQRRADRHLMRANQVLTSPIVCSRHRSTVESLSSKEICPSSREDWGRWRRVASPWQESKDAVACGSAVSPSSGEARRAWTKIGRAHV